jgi:hypothetical protein
MVLFLASLLRFFLRTINSKGAILSENAVLRKENEILLRKVAKKRVRFSFYDRFFFVALNRAADIKYRLTLVKPETMLAWQRTPIRRLCTFEHCPPRRGPKTPRHRGQTPDPTSATMCHSASPLDIVYRMSFILP